jgi:hypothetical protein
VLEQNPEYVTISDINATDITSTTTGGPVVSQLISELKAQFASHGWQGREVGFVFVWAKASQVGPAVDSARTTRLLIKKYYPAAFARASGDGGWDGQGTGFRFEIFFYA